MNRQQRQVERQLLNNEKEALKTLEHNYANALADVKTRIRSLMADDLTQSKIYQLEYQKNLERQITAVLDVLKTDNVQTVNDYLKLCYEDGFIGNLYGLSGDGLEMILPINQRQMAESVTRPTEGIKVSERLYSDVNTLQKDIQATMSRGLAQNMNYTDMAVQLALYSEASLKRAYRIIRTEGGRVQSEAKLDAMQAALDKGADLVRQWDATMDKKTRKSHVQLDGQIRNPDEPFEVNGHSAMAPRLFGIALEDVNCRCTLLTRPRWAVEGERLKWDQDARETITTDDESYLKWKKRYEEEVAERVYSLNFKQKGDTIGLSKMLKKATTERDKYYSVTGLHSDGQNFFTMDIYDNPLRKITPEQLAEKIRKDKSFDGKDVKVYSCDAAGEAAQRLADALGVDVKAPIGKIAIMKSGVFRVAKEYGKDGSIIELYEVDEGWQIVRHKKK